MSPHRGGRGSATVGDGADPALERLRLMTAGARLYHISGLTQREIAARLAISQAKVSRLLAEAERDGIVTRSVVSSVDVEVALELTLEASYPVAEVVLAPSPGPREDLHERIGRELARYLRHAPLDAEVVGCTSWSRAFRHCAAAIDPRGASKATTVVELLGDLGAPEVQHRATSATQRFAAALGAEPVFLRTPGLAADWQAALAGSSAHVQRALALLDRLDVAFIGVGPLLPPAPLRPGPNFFTAADADAVAGRGAVGQVMLRFIDPEGVPVAPPPGRWVVGASLAQLSRVPLTIAAAGGPEAVHALAAALTGGWIDVLVTDVATARALVDLPAAVARRNAGGLRSPDSAVRIRTRISNIYADSGGEAAPPGSAGPQGSLKGSSAPGPSVARDLHDQPAQPDPHDARDDQPPSARRSAADRTAS